jgi:VWFA-related protein
LVLFAAAFAALASAGQTPAAESTSEAALDRLFTESVEVRVVNVEVVVTDREGNRIPGLRPSDFELVVDGEVVGIDYFTEVAGGRAVGSQTADAASGVPELRAGEPVGTSYLVFIDEFFSEPVDRNQVLDALQEQVVAMAPEDRMAIVAYNGEDLDMISNWTQSSDEIIDALRRARGRKAFGLRRRAELRQSETIESTPLLVDPLDTRLSLEERSYVERMVQQVERVVTAATSTLRSFGGPPGRKAFVLFAGEWPYDPVEFIVNDATRPVLERDLRGGDQALAPLIDAANLLGFTIYVADVAGFSHHNLVGADESAPREPTAQRFLRETNVHQTFRHLADQTGGQVFLDGARTRAFEETARDTRSYYWLGFTPDRRRDDVRHDVEVRLVDRDRFGRGVEVRFREDFLDISRQSEVTMAVESALYFGSPPSPTPLQIQIGKPSSSGRRKMEVPLILLIPTDAMTFVPIGETEQGETTYGAQLELRVAVLDSTGATSEIPVVPITLSTGQRPEPGKFFKYETSLKMRRKPHDVVVAVYDVPSGTMLSTSVEVAPGN